MEVPKRIIKNTIILYVQMAITVVFSLYTTRLVLAALGVQDFGIFSVIGGATSMLMFLNSSMTSASMRFMAFYKGKQDLIAQKQIFNITLKMHILIAIAMVVILEFIGFFLFGKIFNIASDRVEVAQLIYHCLVISVFFSVISVPYDAVMNAHENILFIAVTRIIEVMLKLFIALAITYCIMVDKLIIYGILMALVTIVIYFVKLFYSHIKYFEVEVNFKKYNKKSLYKEIFKFAGWSFMGSSSSMISNYGQQIVVNMFFGTSVNAAIGVSNQVSGQVGAFANQMLKALNPVLAKSEGSGNRNSMLKVSLWGSKLSFFLLTILYVPIMLEMPYIFSVWLEKVPAYVIIFLTLQLIRNLVEQLFITLSSSIVAVGDIKDYQLTSFFLNFSPLIVTYIIFSYDFSPSCMYVVYILYSILKSFVILYYAKVKCGLSLKKFSNNVLFRCISCFMIIYLISYLPHFYFEKGFERLLIVSFISVITFFVTVWSIGLIKNEKLIVKDMVQIFLKNKLNINLF